MSDNKMKILQRLEAGEISAEDALAMMNQVKEEPTATPPPPTKGHHQTPPPPQGYHSHEEYEYHHEVDWTDSIVGWVGEVVEGIAGGIKDMELSVNLPDLLSGSYSHNKRTETFVSKPVTQSQGQSQSLTQIELYGKNDKIEIYGYDGDCVHIECAYNARRPDQYVQFHEENGHVAMMYEEKAMRSVRVLCHVPRAHMGLINAVTKNAPIHVAGVAADEIHEQTKSDEIILENITCKQLTANNRNANIKARGISNGVIQLQTTNEKIIAEDVRAPQLSLITTNAGVKTARLDVEYLYIKTTNAGIKLENTFPDEDFAFWGNERTLEAHTTNGNIKFYPPQGIGLAIEANTTDGKVTCNVPLYYADDSVKARLRGESVNYAGAGRRARVLLNTTNASVKIKER